jgi:hypothetical protein
MAVEEKRFNAAAELARMRNAMRKILAISQHDDRNITIETIIQIATEALREKSDGKTGS